MLFATRNALLEDVREEVTNELNKQLANLIVAQTYAKYSHWNVKGVGFFPAHKLIDKVFKYLVEATDTVAERITSLGGVAEGKIETALVISDLPEYKIGPEEDVQEHIEAVATIVADIANQLNILTGKFQTLKDFNSADLTTEVSRTLEEYLYFLEAHLR